MTIQGFEQLPLVFHNRTVLSLLAEAIVLRSGLKATPLTAEL
jgi:hypothetical protein